jgi:hypothetical protein
VELTADSLWTDFSSPAEFSILPASSAKGVVSDTASPLEPPLSADGASWAVPSGWTDAASPDKSSIVQYSITEAQPDSEAARKTAIQAFATRFTVFFILLFPIALTFHR